MILILMLTEETLEKLKINKLYSQMTFGSEKAFGFLQYKGILDSKEW